MIHKKYCILREVDCCRGRPTTSCTIGFCSALKLGLSHQENNGDVLVSRERKCILGPKMGGRSCIMRSFIICIYQIQLGLSHDGG
jgi:hypothetical protein